MSLLEDYRKKKAEDASKENAKGSTVQSGSSLLDIYKDKKTYESFESGDAQKEINAVLGRYQNTLSSYYDTANKQLAQRDVYSYNPDAAQWNEQSNLAISGIEALKGDVYDVISKYEKYLDGDFIDQIYAGLDSDAKSYGDIAEAYKGQSDFYGSFADENAYNKWYEGYKESERIKSLDVDSATKELEALKKERGRYTNTSNIAATHLKALGRTNAVQRFRYEQALSDEEWLSANDPDGVLGLTIKDRPRNTAEATALHQKKVEALTAMAQGKTDEAKVRDYDDRINALERDINNATRIQNGIALQQDALSDVDFEKYAKEGIGKETKYVAGAIWGDGNDIVAYRGEAGDAAEAQAFRSGAKTPEIVTIARNMTEDEVNIYSYYFAKYGEKKAKEYLDSITETVNSRIANDRFTNYLEGNTLNELIFGVEAGLDQFASGIESLFSSADYIPQSATQMTSGMVREDLADDGFKTPEWMGGASLGQAGYDAITTTANMMPSILTSVVMNTFAPGVGSYVGSAMMGASAAGNAYADMVNLGYNKDQAKGYAALVGASEAILQSVIGGIGSLGASAAGKAIGGKVGGALTSGLTETILKNVDNAFARFAIKYGTSMIAEGGEEYLQEVLDTVFKNLVFNENNEVKIVSADAIYSGILGALSAGMLEGVSIAGGEYNVYKKGKTLQGIDGAVNRLAEIGKTFSADSVAYRLAGKVDGNTGAYTIGRLFMEEGAVLSDQNLTTITDALIENGVDEKSAKILANTFARVVEGATLTDSQKAVLENCDPLTSAIRKSIIGENTTVYKRTQSYKQVYNDFVKVLDKKKQGKNTEATPAVAEKTEQTLGVRGEFTSNNDGKTTLKATGEEVSIKEIASIHDGDVVLALDSGKKVNARDVVFKSENEALVYEGLVNAGYSIPAINAIVRTYDGKTGATAFLLGVREQYEYGALGFSQKDSDGVFSKDLDEVTKRTAFEAGRIDKNTDVKEKQERVDRRVQAAKEEGASRKRGEVVYEGNAKNLSKRQKTSIRALKEIARTLGVRFVLFESYENQNGERVYTDSNGVEKSAPNGWYDPATGEIHIDVFAGENADGTILFTAAHELTHMIKEWSPQKYEILKNFLLERYSEKSISVEQLVANQIAKAKDNGRDVDVDEALEEVVADSCESFLVDSEAIAELKKKDATLWEKIKSEIQKLLNKIKILYNGLVPDSDEGKYVRQMKDTLEELHALWTDALIDAGESYSLLATMAESTDPVAVESVTQYSYRSLAKAAGFEAVINEDGTHSFMRDSKNVSKVTIEDIENSAIGAFINYSLERGDIDDVQAKRQKQMFADVCTTACKTNDFSMTMQFMGSAVFTGMKANADKQYGTTYDFPSICTKTQAIIDAMSARMVHLGRGLSSDEIVKLYQKVFASGNPVPCPECYVFSRWIGIGGLLDNIKKYQDYYGNMSVTEVADAYREMRAKVEDFAKEQKMSFGKAKGALTSKLTKEYNKLTEKIEKNENQGEAVKDADRKRLAELEPMMNTVKAMTWLEGVFFADSSLTKVNPKFRVPNEVLFDLNRGEDFATEYKEAWAFRTTQGAGYGKAITPYAEASLGEGVLVTNNTTNAIKGKEKGTLDNYFLNQKGTMDANARKALDKARLKQKIQAFIGGQRFQSTSDARYENASDYLLAALEMQAMKGMVQVYTKVDGAVPAFSAWGFSINQSLMPLNGGLDKDGNVIDTPVGGMNRDIAVNNRKKHESAGTITIGVNDNHIRAMFSQVIRDFIIPYHASGGKADVVAAFRQIQEGKLAKGKEMVRSTDYSRTQSDKVLSDEVLRWQGKTEAEIEQIHKVREARIAILTGGKVDMDVVRGNRFLTALYDKLHDGEWKGVKLAKSKVESQIYPNEFWDQSVTYEESGKITRDYLEYCDDLGFLHRFSGLVPSNGKLVPVNGYDQNGNKVQLTDLAYKYKDGVKTDEVEDFFWKVLTDRRMYDNNGNYLAQKYVTLNDTTEDTVTSFAKKNDGRQYNKTTSLEIAEMAKKMKLSARVTNKKTLASLNKQLEDGEVTEVYRAMAVDDEGNLYPPMAGYVRENGRKVINGHPSVIGEWEQSTESIPWDSVDEEFLTENGFKYFKPNKDYPNGRFERENNIFYKNKNGEWKAKFHLDKDNGSTVDAAYAPYIHTSLSVLNDQFTSAYTRDNLVVVRGYVPNSEVYGINGKRYQANFADKPVGKTKWHSGVVAAQMPETRTVILSRYFMPIDIVDDSVVAQKTKEMMKGKDIEIPFNVVTPKQRRAMEAIGIRIGEARGLKDAPKKADVKYSERKGSSTEKSVSKKKDVENILLRAGTKVAQKYREDIAMVDGLKAHLAEVKEQMNTEHSSDLRDEVIKTQNRISVLEKRIARTEFSAGVVLEKKTTLARERNRVEMRDKKAALRKQIRDSVKRLDTLLNKGTKEKHVKSGQQDLVSSALELAKVFFGDVVLNEDLVRYVDLVEVSERESRLLTEYKDLLDKRDTIKEEIDALEQDPSLTKEEYLQLDNLKKELEKAKKSVWSKSAQLKEVFERARAAYNKKTAKSLVEDLQREYKKLESSEDDFISNAYSEEVYERLEAFKNSFTSEENQKGVTVRAMDEGQLAEVLDAFKMIEYSLKKANALFREGKAESLEEWLKETRSQLVENGKEGKDMPKFLKVSSDVGAGFFWNELKPYYAVERTGSDRIRTLFWDVIEGEQRASTIEKQARDFLRESKKKHNITKKVLEQTKTFTLPDGKTFTLKVSDMMSIYAYSKREQANLHMLQGGFVFGNDNTYKKTADFIKKRTKKLSDEKVKEFLENVTALEYTRAVHQTPYVPGEELLKKVVGEISGNADYKGFADDLQNFMTDLGQLGNETSNKLYGVDLFKEKHYIPLRSAKDYMNHVAMEMGDTVTSSTITNMGMTKQTVPNANNPIVLESLDRLFADHVSQMASYASLAVPVDNMRRVLTFTSKKQENKNAQSMLALMESYMGSGAKKYFDQYLKDVNGNAVKATGYANPLMGLFGRAKKVQVAANLSVAIQQPYSILRATAVINPKYLLSSLGNVRLKSTWEELQKYAPIAITKEIGGFDVGSNGSGKRYILSDEYDTLKDKAKAVFKDSDYRDDLYMSLATIGDEYGWGVIWNAVKKEAADTTKLEVGSKDYFEHCKKRFTEIIVKTQVYDSVNARSGMMRSQNDAVKFATSFMGEPTVTVNMLMDSATKLQRADGAEKKQAGKAFAATVASVVTSALVNNALKSVIYAMRDEDEDETLAEKYLQALGKNIGSDINPLNWLPIARDLVSIAEGWSVDRPDMSLLGEVVTDSTDIVSKMMKDEDVTMEDILNLAGTFGNFAGIPAENVIKDVKAIANTVMRMFDGINQTDLEDAWGYFYKGLSGKEFSEDEMLYDALRDGDEERIDYYKRDFEERDVSFETKVKSAIKKQYVSGKISKDQVKDDLSSYLGYDPKKDEDEIFWIIREWDYSKTKKKDDENYEKYADFYSAVKSGKDLKKTIKFYTDHGVEKQTLASNITREFKPLYKEMTNKERAAIKGYLLNAYVVLGYDRDKKSKDIDGWLNEDED